MGESGASNPNAVGFEAASASLTEAVREALERASADPADVRAAVLAVASVDTEADQKRLLSEVPSLRGVDAAFLVNDVVAAWASGTWGQPGVAAISGTGSNVFGVGIDGGTWRCGGWDYILGDEGAGVWMGLEAMRHATRYRDGRGPYTALADRLCEVYDMDDVAELHEIVYQRLQKSDIAAFAIHVAEVAEAGDEVAGAIVTEAGEQLAEQIVTVIRRIRLPEAFPVALVGSSYKAGPRLVEPAGGPGHGRGAGGEGHAARDPARGREPVAGVPGRRARRRDRHRPPHHRPRRPGRAAGLTAPPLRPGPLRRAGAGGGGGRRRAGRRRPRPCPGPRRRRRAGRRRRGAGGGRAARPSTTGRPRTGSGRRPGCGAG